MGFLEGFSEGAVSKKALGRQNTPFREYDTLCVHPINEGRWVLSESNIALQLVWNQSLTIRGSHMSLGDKGRFRKRVVLANVPSFRFSFRGNMRTYPRSNFRSGGTSECTLVPVFVLGEHLPKPPFWKPPFCQPPNTHSVDIHYEIARHPCDVELLRWGTWTTWRTRLFAVLAVACQNLQVSALGWSCRSLRIIRELAPKKQRSL